MSKIEIKKIFRPTMWKSHNKNNKKKWNWKSF